MAGAHVYLGQTRLDNPTPRSLTAVGQRRDTTAATWTRAAATSRGVTITPPITGRTAECITVVRIPTHSSDINTDFT